MQLMVQLGWYGTLLGTSAQQLVSCTMPNKEMGCEVPLTSGGTLAGRKRLGLWVTSWSHIDHCTDEILKRVK
jgi:hypothetical protein